MIDAVLIGLAALCAGYFAVIVLYAGIGTSFAFIWLFFAALCLCLVYAYFTAGVLRRPNASIYMSVLLAAVYYLTQMRSEQPDALPDGEEKRA